jgi:predicted DNA-binding ribbon-helix-helix protein
MSAVLVAEIMAKKAGRPKTATGEGPPVRLESDLYSMAKYVAAHRGIPVARLVSEFLRPAIETAFAELAEQVKTNTKAAKGES